MLPRDDHKNRVLTALRRSKITALLGPRQCGKTTLAGQIMETVPATFLDLESPQDYNRLQNPELYLEGVPGLVIIDEIQRMPELFPVLRVLADRSAENGRFLILGSASPELVQKSSESLAGRVEFVDLHGFDLSETGTGCWQELWLRGGFPRSFLAASNQDSLAWREGFVRTFLERDIPQLGITVAATTMRRFWTMLAHSHGQVLNQSELGRSMGVSHNTIRSYIDILAATYMIRSVQPWFANTKKRQVKSPKIYFSDTGILHHLLGLEGRESLLAHPVIGASWESFSLEQILRTRPDITPYFWSLHSGAELDLLFHVGGKTYGVEFKYSETPKTGRSMHSALDDLKLHKLFVVYPGDVRFPLREDIEAVPLPDILVDLRAL